MKHALFRNRQHAVIDHRADGVRKPVFQIGAARVFNIQQFDAEAQFRQRYQADIKLAEWCSGNELQPLLDQVSLVGFQKECSCREATPLKINIPDVGEKNTRRFNIKFPARRSLQRLDERSSCARIARRTVRNIPVLIALKIHVEASERRFSKQVQQDYQPAGEWAVSRSPLNGAHVRPDRPLLLVNELHQH